MTSNRLLESTAPPGAGAFTWVEDVADAMIAAAISGRSGHNYLLGGANASYLEFMTLCARELGKPFPAEPQSAASLFAQVAAEESESDRAGRGPRNQLGRDYALVFCAAFEVDSSKAVRELGFRIRPMEEMVRLTVAWLRAAGQIK